MVLVDDDPFAARLAQPGGQAKVDMAAGGAFALNHARRERDIVAGSHHDLARHEADRPERIGKEEIPGLVVGVETFDGARKVEHQQIAGVMREDRPR